MKNEQETCVWKKKQFTCNEYFFSKSSDCTLYRVNRGKNAHGVITPAYNVSTASKISKDESPNGIYF